MSHPLRDAAVETGFAVRALDFALQPRDLAQAEVMQLPGAQRQRGVYGDLCAVDGLTARVAAERAISRRSGQVVGGDKVAQPLQRRQQLHLQRRPRTFGVGRTLGGRHLGADALQRLEEGA